MNTIGKRIKYLRDNANLSQQEVADRAGISRGNISNYEKDRVSPAADTITALCTFFEVSSDWLLTGKERGKKEANVESFIAALEGESVYAKVSDEEMHIIYMLRDFSAEDNEFIKNMIRFKHSQIKNGVHMRNA